MSRSGFHNAITKEEPPEIDLPLDAAFLDGIAEPIDSHRFISRRQRGHIEWSCPECGFDDGEHSNVCLGVD